MLFVFSYEQYGEENLLANFKGSLSIKKFKMRPFESRKEMKIDQFQPIHVLLQIPVIKQNYIEIQRLA